MPFDPCAFDCPAALRYADALFAAFEARDAAAASDLRARLLAPIRLSADGRRLRPDDPAEAVVAILFAGF